MLSSKEIRQQFIDFFLEKDHSFIHSSAVVPEDDPTLLFANAGMNQFKNIFLGLKEPPVKRAVNSQKCIRAGGKHNDLEEVGKDGYHHTFFEMLGNWSFGDYYKHDAIIWAWELFTERWKLDKSLLYATVHDSDQEAFDIWKNHTDIKPEHISFHGDEDNFWEMGDTGPCGPCSEIHIDRGLSHCNMQDVEGHVCAPNGDCDRIIELWNLVFIQYERMKDRSLEPLKHRYVDTGAGLERVAQVLQDKNSNYETDLFMPILQHIAQLSKVEYRENDGINHRVIADHVRCLCFALADGGFPSNEGRGYVLRRILRRASRHGRLLGFAEPFLYKLVDTVVEIMGHHFQELHGKESYIKMVIKAEEERFNKTLDQGLHKFEEISSQLKGDLISGKDAFLLYDTYGFPLDLTMILAEEKGLEVDLEAFDKEMDAQRERARKASKFDVEIADEDWTEIAEITPTEFSGYDKIKDSSFIQRYRLLEDGSIALQLKRTPFYAESGGQIADIGRIYNDESEYEVYDVKLMDDAYVHYARIKKGGISEKELKMEIDLQRRLDIARNHTATHILHTALKEILGDHVQQKGSLVHPDYLRFDFTHFQAMTPDEIYKVEEKVNEILRSNRAVGVEIKDFEKAREDGAIALFGEKYTDEVRVVSVDGYSQELCGGTHVDHSGEIGLFKIASESSIAAGIRRIEAFTGRAAIAHISALEKSLTEAAALFSAPISQLTDKIEAQKQHVYEQDQKIKQLEAELGKIKIDSMMANVREYDGLKLLIQSLDEGQDLKAFSDILRDKLISEIGVFLMKKADKLSLLVVVGKELLPKFHAGKLVSRIASEIGGRGGGRPDSAMAGADYPADFQAFVESIPLIIRDFA
ncbi:MAG TPA: alanine--tRNA ligase [Candidatus Cloacimonetes bacterium]|nr:alanine--tRNA ligase [Candidatus Cloacimonadota bacterium]